MEEQMEVRWAGPAIEGAKRILRVRDCTTRVDSGRWGFGVGARLIKHELSAEREIGEG